MLIFKQPNLFVTSQCRECGGLVVQRQDSVSRGHGFDPHKGHRVVSLSKTHDILRVPVKTQEAMAPSRND